MFRLSCEIKNIPCDPAFFLPIAFARAAQNLHTPGGNPAVEPHTDAALPLGEWAVFNKSLKAASPIFQNLSPSQAVLWQLTTPSQTQYFRSKHSHITALNPCKRSISEVNNHTYRKQTWPPHTLNSDNCGLGKQTWPPHSLTWTA